MIDNSPLESISNNIPAKSINKEEFSSDNQAQVDIDSDGDQLYINKKDLKDHFILIQDIHKILLYYKDLTHQEKFDLCSRERTHMKAYLKEILKKISKII
ncbi:MAG: hypothetical protein ACFFAH_00620 [Promethearchaeota archaeon]